MPIDRRDGLLRGRSSRFSSLPRLLWRRHRATRPEAPASPRFRSACARRACTAGRSTACGGPRRRAASGCYKRARASSSTECPGRDPPRARPPRAAGSEAAASPRRPGWLGRLTAPVRPRLARLPFRDDRRRVRDAHSAGRDRLPAVRADPRGRDRRRRDRARPSCADPPLAAPHGPAVTRVRRRPLRASREPLPRGARLRRPVPSSRRGGSVGARDVRGLARRRLRLPGRRRPRPRRPDLVRGTWLGSTFAAASRVRTGTPVGQVAATGAATGPPLHFEVHYRGAAVDPLTALR